MPALGKLASSPYNASSRSIRCFARREKMAMTEIEKGCFSDSSTVAVMFLISQQAPSTLLLKAALALHFALITAYRKVDLSPSTSKKNLMRTEQSCYVTCLITMRHSLNTPAKWMALPQLATLRTIIFFMKSASPLRGENEQASPFSPNVRNLRPISRATTCVNKSMLSFHHERPIQLKQLVSPRN